MTMCPTHQANLVLKSLSLNRTPGFTGVGIIFYQDLGDIPHIDLGHPTLNRPALPITRMEDIISTLATAADISSSWHDGFHFINSKLNSLTHLSQFISPSLNMHNSIPPHERPSGARHMAAVLVSKAIGIDCVGVLTSSGEICIFRNGATAIRETVKCT